MGSITPSRAKEAKVERGGKGKVCVERVVIYYKCLDQGHRPWKWSHGVYEGN